jgi:hypothetical protein
MFKLSARVRLRRIAGAKMVVFIRASIYASGVSSDPTHIIFLLFFLFLI